jgi:hypothetical protein
MQDHGIGRVRQGPQFRGIRRQPFANSTQVPLNGRGPLSQNRGIEAAHQAVTLASTAACARRITGSASHQKIVASITNAWWIPGALS